jgi:hypothetical protein
MYSPKLTFAKDTIIFVSQKVMEKMTCVSRYGIFEFLVMFYGLCTTPTTFYRIMINILRDFLKGLL